VADLTCVLVDAVVSRSSYWTKNWVPMNAQMDANIQLMKETTLASVYNTNDRRTP
jgi:hypothetical protein